MLYVLFDECLVLPILTLSMLNMVMENDKSYIPIHYNNTTFTTVALFFFFKYVCLKMSATAAVLNFQIIFCENDKMVIQNCGM